MNTVSPIFFCPVNPANSKRPRLLYSRTATRLFDRILSVSLTISSVVSSPHLRCAGIEMSFAPGRHSKRSGSKVIAPTAPARAVRKPLRFMVFS